MPVDLKVPSVGESITEVVIGEWLKAEGDWVAEDESVVIVESDKVNLEVPAPTSGTLSKIVIQSGETASIGDTLGEIEPGDRPADDEGGDATKAAADADADEADAAEPDGDAREPRVTPAARRLLAEHGLKPGDVEASGPGGRLLKEDVQRHVEKAGEKASKPAEKKREAQRPRVELAPAIGGTREEEEVRMSPLRRTVARRLVEAQQSAALLTTFNEVDMSAVMSLRKVHREAFIERHGIKLGFMSFFVRAVVEGLKAYPALNAEIREDRIVYRNYFDVGIAVGGGRGLVVPIIRNAERLTFADIEKTISELAGRARDNKLKLEELKGGTFSITNGGIYGSMLSTPIINPPQSGILGMHNIQDRAVVVDGEVVVRPMMYLAVTYDHRIVDGREAVSFLVRVKECIESPVRMLLEV